MITKERLVEAFKSIKDPELGIDILTLGLIYKYDIDKEDNVNVTMTFTSPFCPYGQSMMCDLESKLKEIGAKSVNIEVTFDPLWEPSEELKEMLGML